MRFAFADYVLDAARRELHRGAQSVPIEPQVFDLLLHIIRQRDRVVSRDDLLAAVWRGRIVSESALNGAINAARRAVGDSGERQLVIRTIPRRGIRFTSAVRQLPDSEGEAPIVEPASLAAPLLPAQEVIFCRTTDDVHLAVAMTGQGPPVVKTANWLNHIEFDLQSPVWEPLFTGLASQFRLVRYDERGNGLSNWDVDDISFEAFVHDLETVVDALQLEHFALLGISQGAAVAIAYATRHPERVSRLVLCGGFVQGWRKRGTPVDIMQREALLTLIQHGWGQDNPAFRQVFTSLYVPGATIDQVQWFNDLERITTSPENAIRLQRAFGEIDVAELLQRVKTPTLVLHSRRDAVVPFEQGAKLAKGIPGARFVELDSSNHLILSHEPAWPRFMKEVCTFLGKTTDSNREIL